MQRMRMLPILLPVLLGLAGSTHAWVLDRDASSIELTGTAEGREATVSVERFTADIALDPDDPGATQVEMVVDAASITSGSDMVNNMLHGQNWFKVDDYPEIVFLSTEVREQGDDEMLVAGELSVLETTRRVELPVRVVEQSESHIRVQGTLSLDRTDYDVGQGAWRSDGTVAHEAEVVFDLTLVSES